jgi:transcriptional regulator with XRE-family HTH domain
VVDPAIEAAKRANFKANLRLRVLRAGMSAREAAEAIGTTRARMRNYFAGRSFPPADTLLKIAAYFQTSPEALCGPAPGLDAAATDAGSPL